METFDILKIKNNIPDKTEETTKEGFIGPRIRKVTSEEYFRQLNVMPPITYSGGFFAPSEPFAHIMKDEKYVPVYSWYKMIKLENEAQFFHVGFMTYNQLIESLIEIYGQIFE